MLDPEMTVMTKGWTAGQRSDFLREVVKTYGCEAFFPWKELLCTDFFIAPASTKYHGSYAGGLFDHSLNMANALCYLTGAQITDPWMRPESPFLVGVFHDACKLGKYSVNAENNGFVYSPHEPLCLYGGHGTESLIRVQQWLQLTEEEALCIRFHMGAYEKDDWDNYDKAIRKYHNVLWTHTADMVASKIMED